MKLKRWLSRGIVLAMVVALMVPMPVAAKSSKAGGKLVKAVTEYRYNNGSWVKQSKTSYTYDKKNNPKQVKKTSFENSGVIPIDAWSTTSTFKYKYKGKKAKSLTVRNEAGIAVETRSYRKGKAAIINRTGFEPTGIDTYEQYSSTAGVTYLKNGLATSMVGSNSNGYSWSATFGMAQKKGIPTQIVETVKDGEDTETYTGFFGKKGLFVEGGNTVDGVYTKTAMVTYTFKKGNVKTATIYTMDEETGIIQPSTMLKFDYTKTKISKTRYMSMINNLLGYVVPGYFTWY